MVRAAAIGGAEAQPVEDLLGLGVHLPRLVDFLARLPADHAATFEFRHDSWFDDAVYDTLRAAGLAKPRVKILPLFRIGRERSRTHGYGPDERLTAAHMRGRDPLSLQCSTSRMVTSRGVYVCPILIDTPSARLGRTLRESLRSFPLAHGACYTCWATGATCRN